MFGTTYGCSTPRVVEVGDIVFPADGDGKALAEALATIFWKARKYISEGATILILTDRNVDADNAPIPVLLSTAGLHHHLIDKGLRSATGIIVETGKAREVTMHDGSTVVLRKLARDYDPTDRAHAIEVLEKANCEQCLVTGLIYINPEPPSLIEMHNLLDEPLNRLASERLPPTVESLEKVNATCDAQEVVEAVPRELGGHSLGALDAPEAATLGPLPRGPVRARDAQDLVPESQEALAALDQKGIATHKSKTQGESSFVDNRAP